MRIFGTRTISGIAPYDDEARRELARIQLGKSVYLEIIRARNPRQHKLLFALLGAMVEHSEFPSIEAALDGIKVATGHCDTIVMPDTGECLVKMRSIAYANMSQAEFEPWFESAVRVVCERWIPGVKSDELRQQLSDMVQ